MRSHSTPCLVANPNTHLGALDVVLGAKGNSVEAIGQEGVGRVYDGFLHSSGGDSGRDNV